MIDAILALLAFGAALACAILVWRRAASSAASAGLVWGLTFIGASEVAQAALFLDAPAHQPMWLAASRCADIVSLPGWAILSVAFARPDAAVRCRRWGGILLAIGGLAAGVVTLTLLGQGARFYGALEGGLFPYSGYRWAVDALALPAVAFVVLQATSTLRGSRGVVRWQIKYFLLGVLALFGFQLFVLAQALVSHGLRLPYLRVQPVVALLSVGLIAFGLVRHRVLEVAVFVSRHVVYRSLAVGTAIAYLLALGVSAAILRMLAVPVSEFGASVVVFVSALALVVALLSERLRWRVKRMVTRNFYINKYDYRREWTELTTKLTSVASLDAVMPRLVATVVESMGLTKAALYIAEDRGFRLAESAGEEVVEPSRLDLPPALLARIGAEACLVPLDSGWPPEAGGGVAALRATGFFLLVPLVVKHDVLGLIAVSPPRDSVLSEEDEEFLRTVAAQAATTLLNVRLGERLAQARELEAFHRVSSFLLHDLKNCAANLSLVAQNTESFAAAPEFRRDAFESIQDSVGAIQQLIARLSHLPKGLELRLERIAITPLITEAVTRARRVAGRRIEFACALEAVDPVLADADQCRKVLDNLLLNAIEAMPARGEVRVRTATRGSRVLIEVADTGPGIPDAILQGALFTPFRTTKPRGLGIGLYQVKTIVDAHGGHIELQSRAGHGARITIELPAAPVTDP
jgi:hypothetical protein